MSFPASWASAATYPHGIKGGVILPEAQIVAEANPVDAISSHRPYRAAIEMALTEILHGRGIAYDADVVNACRSLFLEEDYVLPA
jgi:HD-GYP domain-containing protein (c-di-GMP phosphodiesterase class II)